jgi:hypothetical protein
VSARIVAGWTTGTPGQVREVHADNLLRGCTIRCQAVSDERRAEMPLTRLRGAIKLTWAVSLSDTRPIIVAFD